MLFPWWKFFSGLYFNSRIKSKLLSWSVRSTLWSLFTQLSILILLVLFPHTCLNCFPIFPCTLPLTSFLTSLRKILLLSVKSHFLSESGRIQETLPAPIVRGSQPHCSDSPPSCCCLLSRSLPCQQLVSNCHGVLLLLSLL